MTAKRILKSNTAQFEPYIKLAIQYAPIAVPFLVAVLFLMIIIWPSARTLSSLKTKIESNEELITTVDASMAGLEKMQKDLLAFEVKVREFEKRLPTRMKTTLTIETLQEITRQAKLKFSSLEPMTSRKHILKETKDTFVELPIKGKLKCNYYELIDFLKKIEKAGQLMKITYLNIKNDPKSAWEQNVEFSISAFSRGGVGD